MNKKLIILLISLFLLSCEEEIANEFDCVTLTADLTAGLEAYSNNPADTASCLTLKNHAAEFISNGCDTTGIGDLSFLADSLDCGMMACETPIANLLRYGLSQTLLVDPDSLTYCAYYDSSVVAMEAIVAAGGCEQEGFEGVTQEMVDSVKSAGCDWTAPPATGIIGSWNFVATEYDTTCTGNGEVFLEGTMVFDYENVTLTSELRFDSFCSDMYGSLVDDTTCAIYNGNVTLSMLHEVRANDGMTATDDGCAMSLTNTYTFNESLYINNVVSGYDAADCEGEEGVFSESDSSCTFTTTLDVTIDGNTATFNQVYIDEDFPDDSYCDVFVLTKQ